MQKIADCPSRFWIIWLIYESSNLTGPKQFLTFQNKKFTNLLLRFLDLNPHIKNQVDSSILTWNIVDSRILQSDRLCFLNLYLYAKNQVYSSILFWDTADLWILQSDWFRAFLTQPYYKLKNYLLQFFNLCQHTKNQFDLLVYPWDIAHLRRLYNDSLRAFLVHNSRTIIFS